MATAPANDVLEANEVEQIVSIAVSDIEAGERLRAVDPVWAAALGAVMAREGQRTPIEVCRLPGRSHWTLVTGGHRHAGAVDAGIEYLKAIIVGPDRAERRMREVSENLWRKDLNPIDRAAFIAELVTLHKQRAGIDPDKDGRAVSAATRWQKALQSEADDANVTMTFAYGWNEEVARDLGFSKSTIERDLLLYRRLAPSLISSLRDVRHPVASNATQLRALAKLDEDQQRAAVERLLAGAKSVSEAVASANKREAATPEDKRLSAFRGAFERMGIAEKSGALRQLPLPAGVAILQYGDRASVLAALQAGFALASSLCDGEPVEDDAIGEAAGLLQQALSLLEGDRS